MEDKRERVEGYFSSHVYLGSISGSSWISSLTLAPGRSLLIQWSQLPQVAPLVVLAPIAHSPLWGFSKSTSFSNPMILAFLLLLICGWFYDLLSSWALPHMCNQLLILNYFYLKYLNWFIYSCLDLDWYNFFNPRKQILKNKFWV